VSRSSTGGDPNDLSVLSRSSADGPYVVWESNATNILNPDTNGANIDLFIFNRNLGTSELVSQSTAGIAGNAGSTSSFGVPSPNGRYVAFLSNATNLDASPDTNGNFDAFRRDRCVVGGVGPGVLRKCS
jgi:hypothetical protein